MGGVRGSVGVGRGDTVRGQRDVRLSDAILDKSASVAPTCWVLWLMGCILVAVWGDVGKLAAVFRYESEC